MFALTVFLTGRMTSRRATAAVSMPQHGEHTEILPILLSASSPPISCFAKSWSGGRSGETGG